MAQPTREGIFLMATVIHSVTLKDAKTLATKRVGNEKSIAVHVPLGAQSITDLTDWNLAFQGALDDVTEGLIIDANITLKPDLNSGNKVSPVAGSDVQKGANLAVFLADGVNTDTLFIPSILQSLIGSDGQTIANSGAMAVLTAILFGSDGVLDVAASNRYEILYQSFKAAKKAFRK